MRAKHSRTHRCATRSQRRPAIACAGRPEVVDVLEPHREAQQAFRDAPLGLEARAALDQRLDAAEARRAAREAHRLLAAAGARPVGELEGQHATCAARHLAQRELVIGVIGQAGVVDVPTTDGCAARRRASSPALATCRATRTCRVRRPRSRSHAASGASTPPIVRRMRTSRWRSEGSRVVITPASTSECPARYFVALCQARSAPSSSGRCRSGVANVESQQRRAPPAVRRRPPSAMSVRVRSGLEGVSTIASAAPSQARWKLRGRVRRSGGRRRRSARGSRRRSLRGCSSRSSAAPARCLPRAGSGRRT